MRTILRRRTAGMAALLLCATAGRATLSAHDMWIEPTAFESRGEIVGLRLRVGQDLIGDPLFHDPALIKDFIVDDADGRRPVVGRPGTDPAGLVRLAPRGVAVVAYASRSSRVEMAGEKFDSYLREEGLDAVAATRLHADSRGRVRERFSRCAKSLLSSGGGDPLAGTRPMGLALELIPERNPYALTNGGDLPVRLLYLGQPLRGALVVAFNRMNPADKQSARSDRDGRVRFRLPRPGMWLVKTVHAVPAAPGTDADWESVWASLTFNVPQGAQHATH